ncbi:MAG: hypothetical protein IJE93_10660 [Clostridia bacterium]|nr:hypothetical protein [Clostridia bacterium]
MKNYPWLKIDTASIMFSSLSSPEWGRTFHMSAYFGKEINPDILRKACEDLRPYYPSMFSYLKRGFFWNYLALTDKMPEICSEDEKCLCPIAMKKDRTPDFRLTYSENRVTMDCSHSLGDGMGAGRFAEALIVRYNELMKGADGKYVSAQNPSENTVNAFAEHYKPDGETAPEVTTKAFHFDEKYENQNLKLIFVELPVDEIKKKAKEKGLSVTEYYVSVLILSVIKTADKPINQPVVIGVPVNLRGFFTTKSVRNFTIQSHVSFSPGGRSDYSLDEICDAVRGQLKQQLTADNVQKTVNKYGSLVNNPVLRIVPNVIKLPVLKKKQRSSHECMTSIFTNVGVCTLPEELSKSVTAVELVNGDASRYGLGVTTSAISYNGRLSVCFSHTNNNTAWCESCVEILKDLGFSVNTYTRERKGFPSQTPPKKEKEVLCADRLKAYFNI